MKYFALLLILLCFACGSAPKNLHTPSKVSDEYYLSKQGTEERLYAMLSGTFVCYLADGDKKPWLLNDGKDTMLFRSVPVGDIRKGFWLYQEMVMSHMPERPIEQVFVKIEPSDNRDSILLSYYTAKEMYRYATMQPNSGNAKNVDFNRLETTGCSKFLVKKEQTFFQGGTIRSQTCPCTNKGEDVAFLSTDEAVYPLGMSISQFFWTEKMKLHTESRLYLERKE